MPAHNYTSTANKPTLSAAVASNVTSLTVNAVTGWPSAPTWAEIARGTPSAEIVEVTGISGTTLTVNRGMDGTLASAHSLGDLVELIVPAVHFSNEEVHTNAAGAVHGVSGAMVGTTDIQSLTQKTYQGGHKSVYSDVNPGGLAASFESIADTNAARDGFVHRNTAGDANRRGLYLEQSGSPRGEFYNDGTTKLTPNAGSARAGFEINSTAANIAAQITNATNANAVAFKVLGDGTVTSTSNIAAQNGSVISANFGGGQFGATSSITSNAVVSQQSLRQPWVASYGAAGINTQVPLGSGSPYIFNQTFVMKEDGWADVRANALGFGNNGTSGGVQIARGFCTMQLYDAANTALIENPGFTYSSTFVVDDARGLQGYGVFNMEQVYATKLSAGTTYTLRFSLWRDTTLGWAFDNIRIFITSVVRNA